MKDMRPLCCSKLPQLQSTTPEGRFETSLEEAREEEIMKK